MNTETEKPKYFGPKTEKLIEKIAKTAKPKIPMPPSSFKKRGRTLLYTPESEGTGEGIISNHISASVHLVNKVRIKGLWSSLRYADNAKYIHRLEIHSFGS